MQMGEANVRTTGGRKGAVAKAGGRALHSSAAGPDLDAQKTAARPGGSAGAKNCGSISPAVREQFTEKQAGLPGVIGIALERIVHWRDRNLTEGRDWVNAGEVRWTKEAVRVLMSALHIPNGSVPYGVPRPSAQGVAGLLTYAGPERGVLRAWAGTKNMRILMAHREGVVPKKSADLVRVWVKDCTVFRRGQAVPARHQQGDLWEWDRELAQEIKTAEAQRRREEGVAV